MECNILTANHQMLRAIVLYPGPQTAPFANWTSILDSLDPMARFHFAPFVLIQKTIRPLSIDAMRQLAHKMRGEDETGRSLTFTGPLVLSELFDGYRSLALASMDGTCYAILSPPAPIDTDSKIYQLYHNMDAGPCRVRQGALCNAIIRMNMTDTVQSVGIERGREIWLPSRTPNAAKGDRAECIKP